MSYFSALIEALEDAHQQKHANIRKHRQHDGERSLFLRPFLCFLVSPSLSLSTCMSGTISWAAKHVNFETGVAKRLEQKTFAIMQYSENMLGFQWMFPTTPPRDVVPTSPSLSLPAAGVMPSAAAQPSVWHRLTSRRTTGRWSRSARCYDHWILWILSSPLRPWRTANGHPRRKPRSTSAAMEERRRKKQDEHDEKP